MISDNINWSRPIYHAHQVDGTTLLPGGSGARQSPALTAFMFIFFPIGCIMLVAVACVIWGGLAHLITDAVKALRP